MDYPKKWWWLVLIVVPIAAALIGLLKTGGGGDVINIAGTQFTGDVALNPVTVIIEEVQQLLGKELDNEVVETLQKASDSVGTGNYGEAISLLESVADSTQVPAFFNNLGAAYMAAGDFDNAKFYLDKVDAKQPDDPSQFNLGQLPECGPLVGAKESMSGGDSFEGAEAIAPGLYTHNEGLGAGVHRYFKGHPVNGEVGTWLAPSGSQIRSPFACPYSRLQ